MVPDRATRWQEAWARAGLAVARREIGRPKFFALVAYPGASGFLHVGHLREYVYADALHRFHRALGESVFFPFGLHASGLPPVTFAQRVQNRDPVIEQALEDAGVPPAVWPALVDPEEAARFLGDEYRRNLRQLGVLIDESAYVTTVDDDYRRFVQWQLRTLAQAGEVSQGTYFASVCPVCGPVAVDPSETDLSSGGTAEIVRFDTVPFALDDGRILLAATLRAETVYGVTNLWLAPAEELVVWHHGDRQFLVARDGGERLVEQHGGHLGHPVSSAELAGRAVTVPLGGPSVPILIGPLVDPKVGTGVVMSVPAHAPADAAATAALPPTERERLVAPKVVLEIDRTTALTSSEEALLQGDGTPAVRALRAVGSGAPPSAEAVERATERLYRIEFVRGRMTVPGLVGLPVPAARERVAQELRGQGTSFELQEFSIPVVCRNGHRVIIRKVDDQWYLRYSDPAWKAATLAGLRALTTYPPEFARELPGIVQWFGDRPCARKGRWLGTPLPLDPSWIVEPIADSTFYMAYFVVRRFVTGGFLKIDQLSDAFFDQVFRGIGPGEPTVPPEVAAELRSEFLYWYPLDINMGGHEHKTVHFPAFLYTHTRLLPPELQPRSIHIHGWVTGPGGAKISKKEVSSKGGRVPPIAQALDRWGPDALRLYHATAAEPSAEVEWTPEAVDAAQSRLADIERLLGEARGSGPATPALEAWLFSKLHGVVARVRAAFAAADFRDAAGQVYVTVPAILRRYYARGGVPGSATDRFGRAWTLLLAPITPHLAEEAGHGRFEGLVAVQRFPEADEFPLVPAAEAREEYLDRVEDDLRAVLRPSAAGAPPDEAVFFVAAPWKRTVEAWMRSAVGRGETPTVRAAMERLGDHPELAAYRSEIPAYVQRVGPLLRAEPAAGYEAIDEGEVLREAEGYLVRRFGFRQIRVLPEAEAEPSDPMGRRVRSRPGRPAFYLVRPGATAA
jgi:leucyl-tRNA synthetase